MRNRLLRRLREQRWPPVSLMLLGVAMWFVLVVAGQATFHYLG